MQMDNFKLMKCRPSFVVLVLLNIHLVNGAVSSSGIGDNYLGESFTLTFTITPSFAVSATISIDGVLVSSCIPSSCIGAIENATFTASGAGIVIVFSPVSSSHQGIWNCQNNNGDTSNYSFQPESRPSSGDDKEGTEGWIIGVAVGASCVAVSFFVVGVVFVCRDRFRLILRVNSIQNINDKAEIRKSVVMKKDDTQDITDALPELNHSNCVLWKHNGETLFNTNIKNASLKDVGLYESNINGGVMVKIQLIVLGTENTVYVKKGNETFLGIDQDNTTAKWTHNGRPLTTNGMRRTRINIQNALPNNTGLYVCTLSQSEKSFKHQLIVIDEALIDDNPSLKQYTATLSQ